MPTYPYLTQVVHGAARSRPDQPCLIYGARRTSNAQFRDRVARLAGVGRRSMAVPRADVTPDHFTPSRCSAIPGTLLRQSGNRNPSSSSAWATKSSTIRRKSVASCLKSPRGQSYSTCCMPRQLTWRCALPRPGPHR